MEGIQPWLKRDSLIFAPEINPASFVLLCWKGEDRNSWSIRDYSDPTVAVEPRYAKDFPFTIAHLLNMKLVFEAPYHKTADRLFWNSLTTQFNHKHLSGRPGASVRHPIATGDRNKLGALRETYRPL